MKSYTDIEQIEVISKILSLESADMYYEKGIGDNYRIDFGNYADIAISKNLLHIDAIPCWSLAALLGVLPNVINNETLFIETSAALWHIGYRNIYTARADNLIDACYEMILKLHELKML